MTAHIDHPQRSTTSRRSKKEKGVSTSWDPVAHWYNGWVGEEGSEHHREVAIPALLSLLDPQPGEEILDVGAGQGVLAPYIVGAGARYTGVDASPRLLQIARRRRVERARFVQGDAARLAHLPELDAASFDAAIFMLSIQDMDPLEDVLGSAAWALKPGGRVCMLLTHPAFRVPRQSGWGWDDGRKLQYRRVDRYLTSLAVPMKTAAGNRRFVTRSFHRPLGRYINGLAGAGLLVERMLEVPAHRANSPPERKDAADRARREIPLFLGLRARKVSGSG
jgi:ubiquinone/menaquinone biosynthesis C-methylase UbiE